MTEQEAIKDIQRQLWEINTEGSDVVLSTESLRLAIKALEEKTMFNEIMNELAEFRAIGTIEEFKELKECIDCSATVRWINKNRIEVNGEQFTRVAPIEEDIDW